MTYKVIVYKGREGDRGIDGEDGTGVDDIRYSLIDNPVFSALHNNCLGDITWSRSGEALNTDRYGNYVWVSGDDITNYIRWSNDFSNWDDFSNRWSITSTGNPDPLGGNDATHMILDQTTVSGDVVMSGIADGMAPKIYHTLSFWFKVISGNITSIEINFGTDIININDGFIVGQFKRYEFPVDLGSSGAVVDINIIGDSGSAYSVFKTQYENGSIAHDPIDTTTIPVSVPNPLSPARQNNMGYLIEGQKTNLIINSENLLRSNWSVSGCEILPYDGGGVFGDVDQNIEVSFNNSTAIISSTGTFTEGVEYSVSFFAYVLSGSVTSISVSLAGTLSSAFTETIPKNEFRRLSVKIIAGASGDLSLICVSPDLAGRLLLTGFQVEEGETSSYIRNGGTEVTRPEDEVEGSYTLPSPNDNWSCVFNHKSTEANSNVKYIFNNGLSGSDEFSAWFIDEQFKISIAGVISIFDDMVDSENIGVTYDSGNISVYKDGFISGSATNTGVISSIATTINIGGDEASSNNADSYLSRFKFWNETFTSDEMRHIAGV